MMSEARSSAQILPLQSTWYDLYDKGDCARMVMNSASAYKTHVHGITSSMMVNRPIPDEVTHSLEHSVKFMLSMFHEPESEVNPGTSTIQRAIAFLALI